MNTRIIITPIVVTCPPDRLDCQIEAIELREHEADQLARANLIAGLRQCQATGGDESVADALWAQAVADASAPYTGALWNPSQCVN